jgi:hypothetical protein
MQSLSLRPTIPLEGVSAPANRPRRKPVRAQDGRHGARELLHLRRLIRSLVHKGEQTRADYFLSLRKTADGWALAAPRGGVVFEAHGRQARRRCLEVARDFSVLVLRAEG